MTRGACAPNPPRPTTPNASNIQSEIAMKDGASGSRVLLVHLDVIDAKTLNKTG
jgi:hypothetical protein